MSYGIIKSSVITVLAGLGMVYAQAYADTQTTTGNPQMQNQTSTQQTVTSGDAFLASNKVKPGVVTTPSGLQYKVIVAGTGPKPTANDTVTVHYAGTLINGFIHFLH